MPRSLAVGLSVLALAAFGVACGDEGPARDAVGTVDELSENVENSARVYDETYDAARKAGEDRIEAGGEAYDAVLDIPEEEEEKKAR